MKGNGLWKHLILECWYVRLVFNYNGFSAYTSFGNPITRKIEMRRKTPGSNWLTNSKNRMNRSRRLCVEQLEGRNLLAADLHNFNAPCDVNNDGAVTANDALVVLNQLSRDSHQSTETILSNDSGFFDVNNDLQITAADALKVINTLDPEQEILPKVELLLSARDFNDIPYGHDQDGFVEVEVGNPFMLEVGYEEFIFDRVPFGHPLALFQLLADLDINSSSALTPFLNETQQLFISKEIHAAANQVQGFRFYIESPVPDAAVSNSQYFSSYASFARDPKLEIDKALLSFGYGLSEFKVSDISDEAGNLIYQVNWLGQQFGNVDLPNVSLEIVLSDPNISIETRTTEIGPYESDGSTPNSRALRFNLDNRSRSYNQTEENQSGDPIYNSINNSSSFDSSFGFIDIGGFASLPLPNIKTSVVDAFSIPLIAVENDDNIEIEVRPSEQPEAIVLYSGETLAADEVLLESIDSNGNGIANLKIRASQAPGGGSFSFLEDSTTVAQDSGYAVIVVKRTSGASGKVSLDFETTDGTAISGEHYSYTAGTLEFNDAERYKVIRIPVLPGNEYAVAKSFVLSLTDRGSGLGSTKIDHEVIVLGENANSEPAGEELVEFILTARGLDNQPLHHPSIPTVGINVGEPFYLEVSYDMLDDTSSGLLQVISDVLLSDTSILQPVFHETQQLIIDASVVSEFENGNLEGLEFSIPEPPPGITDGQLIYTVTADAFGRSLLDTASDALLSFGYSPEQFKVTRLDFGAVGDLGVEIHWIGDEFGNVNLPNITLDVIEANAATDIPTQTIEYAPFLADGVTPNPDALEFNIDFRSRSALAWSSGAYSPAYSPGRFGYHEYTQITGAEVTVDGFESVGGFRVRRGSQPIIASPTLPFDVLSLKVVLKTETEGVQVRVKPSDRPESVLAYDRSLPVTSEMVRLEKLDTNGNGVSEINIKSANKPELFAFQSDVFVPDFRANNYVPVTVIRLGNADEATEVTITTRDGTAKAGEHYLEFSETIVFARDERSKTIHIPLLQHTSTAGRQLLVNLEYSNSEGMVRISSALVNTTRGVVIGPDGKLVELLLTARNLDDSLKMVQPNGLIEVAIDEPFYLEVAYDDWRPNNFLQPPMQLGIFQLFTDIAVSQPNVLMPILNETQRLIIDFSVLTEIGNGNVEGLEFSIPQPPPGITDGQLIYTATADSFSRNLTDITSDALLSFGYSPEQFKVTRLDFGAVGDLGVEIHWIGDEFGNVNLPNITLDVIEANAATDIPTQTIEYAPFLADGVTPNPDAVRFNLNTFSRTFNPTLSNPSGEQFYSEMNRGTFDPATGFDEVGGLGKVGTGIPDITVDGSFHQPFDAYSILVKITEPVDGFSVSVDLGEDPEALLLYGMDVAAHGDQVYLEAEDTNLNGVSVLRFVTQDESIHATGKIKGHVFIDQVENSIVEILSGATPIRDGIKGMHEIGIGSRKILLESRSDENDSKRDIVLLQETSEMGEFSFENIPSGTYTVTHVEDRRFISMEASSTRVVTLSNTNSEMLVNFPLLSLTDQLDILASTYF